MPTVRLASSHLLLLALVVAGCGLPDDPGVDAGQSDSGTTADAGQNTDAGPHDGGPVDAGVDAG